MEIVLFSQCPRRLKPAHLSILAFVYLWIHMFHTAADRIVWFDEKEWIFVWMYHNRVANSCFSFKCFFFQIGRYTECAVISVDKNLFIMTHCGSRRSRNSKQIGLKVGRRRATPLALFLILWKFALDYLYLLLIGCRTNNFIMTVKCQNVVKCELSRGGHFNFICTGVCGHRIGKLAHPQTKAGPKTDPFSDYLQ